MTINKKIKGVFLGAFGAACYGTNPLFALPLYSAGLTVASVLFYRYAVAVTLFAVWLKFVQHYSFKVTKKQFLFLTILGLIYAMSSLTLFSSYKYIDVGVATTILYIYPILVAVIMFLFFHEKISLRTVTAIALTTTAILLFYNGKEGEKLNVYGLVFVLLSALCDSSYLVSIKKMKPLENLPTELITFYVMIFGLINFFIQLRFGMDLQIIKTPLLIGCAVGLAVVPTIVALGAVTKSVRYIGPTLSAVLGAFEPTSAIVCGVFVFGEELTYRNVLGFILIVTAVFTIVLPASKEKRKVS